MVFLIFAIITATYAVPASVAGENKKILLNSKEMNEINNDLRTASSSYSHQYSDWGGRKPGGYGYSVTGFGTIDDKYTADPLYKGFNADNTIKYSSYSGYGNEGYNGYGGYKSTSGFNPSRNEPFEGNVRGGYGGYGGAGYEGGQTYGGGISGYGSNGYGGNGYLSNGYGSNGYGSNGYESTGYGISKSPYGIGGNGYAGSLGGNGGYGGYGGNGGLNSYLGYNNPYYQGGGHLGYGYQAKKIGYGSIYNSGVTPSLVTGYRGYTKK